MLFVSSISLPIFCTIIIITPFTQSKVHPFTFFFILYVDAIFFFLSLIAFFCYSLFCGRQILCTKRQKQFQLYVVVVVVYYIAVDCQKINFCNFTYFAYNPITIISICEKRHIHTPPLAISVCVFLSFLLPILHTHTHDE